MAGGLLLTCGLASVVYGLVSLERAPVLSRPVFDALTIGTGALILFALIERRSKAPLLPLSVARSPRLAAANVASLIKSSVGMSQLYILTLYLQHVRALSPLQTGLTFVPMALATIGAAVVTGRCMTRLGGVRTTALLGCLFSALGLGLLVTQLHPDALIPVVMIAMVTAEIGFTTADVPLNLAAGTALPRHPGLAAGLLNTATDVGNALGLGLTAAVVGYHYARLGTAGTADLQLADSLRWV